MIAKAECLAIDPSNEAFMAVFVGKAPFSERVVGIEPTWPAWKAGTLPLSYTRNNNCIISRIYSLTIIFLEIIKKSKILTAWLFNKHIIR